MRESAGEADQHSVESHSVVINVSFIQWRTHQTQ